MLVATGLFGATDPAGKPAKPISRDQIVTAAAKLAKAPIVSEAAARGAAQALLAQNYGTFSNLDVEQLAVRLLQQASIDADADLRAQMTTMKKTAAEKKARRTSTTKSGVTTTDQPVSAVDTADLLPTTDGKESPADAKKKKDAADEQEAQARLQLLQDRKAQFAQLLANLQRHP